MHANRQKQMHACIREKLQQMSFHSSSVCDVCMYVYAIQRVILSDIQ